MMRVAVDERPGFDAANCGNGATSAVQRSRTLLAVAYCQAAFYHWQFGFSLKVAS